MDIFGWNSTLTEFKKKVADFKAAYDFLINNKTTFSPAITEEKTKLISRANVIKTTIETVTKAIDKANGLLQTVKSSMGMNGLGVLPALPVMLPVAVVAASATAISYWLTDFNRLRSQMYEDMVANGSTPQQATAILATVPVEESKISSSLVRNLLPIVALIGIGYYFIGTKK